MNFERILPLLIMFLYFLIGIVGTYIYSRKNEISALDFLTGSVGWWLIGGVLLLEYLDGATIGEKKKKISNEEYERLKEEHWNKRMEEN